MIRTRVAALLVVGALLSGCLPCGSMSFCPAPSPAYRQMENLSGTERLAAMVNLSIEDRLDVYHDVYVRSGHPKTMLTDAFVGTGEDGFDAVMRRMVDPPSFIEYFWIIHTMGLRREIDVCDQRNFGPLNEKARRFHIADPKHPVPIQFDSCVLPL